MKEKVIEQAMPFLTTEARHVLWRDLIVQENARRWWPEHLRDLYIELNQ